MAAKIKCPSCGAKNDAAAHRCRICTGVINPGAAPAPAPAEPAAPAGIDHFDAGDIARQIRPARERFTSGGGALSARLSAAGGPPAEVPATEVLRTDGPPSGGAAERAPIEYEAEPFDPDALFRDMS